MPAVRAAWLLDLPVLPLPALQQLCLALYGRCLNPLPVRSAGALPACSHCPASPTACGGTEAAWALQWAGEPGTVLGHRVHGVLGYCHPPAYTSEGLLLGCAF